MRVGGVPSRARVSPDGRYGATTVFVTGHSYASTGAFSTETLIIDLATGQSLGNLEEWKVEKDGQTIDAPDVNFWGVTFAGGLRPLLRDPRDRRQDLPHRGQRVGPHARA